MPGTRVQPQQQQNWLNLAGLIPEKQGSDSTTKLSCSKEPGDPEKDRRKINMEWRKQINKERVSVVADEVPLSTKGKTRNIFSGIGANPLRNSIDINGNFQSSELLKGIQVLNESKNSRQ